MSLTLKNRVYETTITTSTGSYLLAGVVNASCRPFADAGNGGVIPYIVEQGTKSEWGIGTYDSGTNTLARTTILGNYLGTTAAISWAAGTKNIYSPELVESFGAMTFNNSFDVSAIKLAESAAPSTPASGYVSIYPKTDGKLYLKDDAGTETDLTAGSTLDSLSDVVITSATNLDLLQFNGTNWVNRTLAAAGIQPLDATLTALAGLTIAANSLSIGSGADAFSQTTFAANTFPARASTGNLVAKTITDFALTILDDADAATVRTTIGAGTGSGDALVANTLDQFADVTQTATKTLAITESTTLAGGTHSGTNTGDQTSVSGNAGTVTVADAGGDTTTWVLLGTSQTGSLAPATASGLTYNATTDALTATTFIGALTGNASTATSAATLTTARTINGTSFNGSANITITCAGSTLSDTVTVAKGGTGLTAVGTALQVLRTNAGATAMEWATPAGGGDLVSTNNLSDVANAGTSRTSLGVGTGDSPQFTAANIGHATDTTITRVSAGVIAVEGNTIYAAGGTDVVVADGGTGLSSVTAFAVLCGGTTSTGAFQSIASVGTAGQVLTSNGAGALPTFQAAGGVSDGDKGDVTISSSGTVYVVDSASSAFALSGDISPAQITSNQNDYNPTGLSTASVLRLDCDANRDITGIAGGADGRMIVIHNIGSGHITLKHQSASSSAANRFKFPTTYDFNITVDASVALWYDGTSARWRLLDGALHGACRTIAGTLYVENLIIGFDGSGGLDAKTIVYLSGTITPATITSQEDDYTLGGSPYASQFRLASDASRTITGIDSSNLAGRVIVLHNIGANAIVLSNQNASSSAANRFALGDDVTLVQDQSITLIYDGTSSRYRPLTTGSGGGGGAESNTPFEDSIADTETATIDWSASKSSIITLTGTMGSYTVAFSNIVKGKRMLVVIDATSDALASVTWPAVKWPASTPPAISTANDVFEFYATGTTAGSVIGFQHAANAS